MNIRLFGWKITVCRTKWHTKAYFRKWYANRRKKGLCSQCGESVIEINSSTNKPYRKCLFHRRAENEQALERRYKRKTNYN